MKRIFSMAAVFSLLTLVACKEPTSDASTTAEQTPETPAPSAPVAPAAVVPGIKPVSADAKYPPGPLSMQVTHEYCNIESINTLVYQDALPKTILRNQPVNVVGWIVDKANNQLATDVALVIETPDMSKRWEVSNMPAVARQDVVDYYKDFPPQLLNSGFSMDLDLSEFEPGTYHLFVTRSAGDEMIICDHYRHITLQ